MIINVAGVFVDDQEKALQFYTKVLGFLPKHDIPVGNEGGDRWLTVVSPERPDGVEFLLEPNGNPVASTYQQGLMEQGIPATSFAVDDIEAEFARLGALGVEFTVPPTDYGTVWVAIFKDTCGNLIQIAQETGG